MSENIADPTLERLEDQISWYDRKSIRSQRFFKWFKGAVIVSGGAIPLFVAIGISPIWAAALGALIVILEGLQHLNQYHHNWITYRSTCEALKHEKYLYLGEAGYYKAATDAHALLAERIEALISQEHAKWIYAQERSAKIRPPNGSNVSS